MAKYRVTRSKKERVSEQKAKGVEDGDIKRGAKGKTKRRWNEKKGRWEKLSVVSRRGVAFDTKRGAGAKGRDRENPSNSGSYQAGQGMTSRSRPTSGRYKAVTKTKRPGPQLGSGERNKPNLGDKGGSYDSRKTPGSRTATAAAKAKTAKQVQEQQRKKFNPGAPRKGDKKTTGPVKQVYNGSQWVTYATKTSGSKVWKPNAYGKKYSFLMGN